MKLTDDVMGYRQRPWPSAAVWIPLTVIILSVGAVRGFCPSQCQCNDLNLETDCSTARLDVVPILLNPALRVLRLAGNRIVTIRQSLDFYADLEVLDLSRNALTSLGQRQLESQRVLRWLNISGNLITRLEPRGFQGLAQLEVLDLHGNELTAVEDGALVELDSLTALDLSFNKIERLGDNCFAPLGHLRSLNLRGNRLTQLAPSPSWTPLGATLLQLDLSGNLLAQLDGGVLGGLSALTELRQLDLSNNTLHHLHYAAFDGLNALAELNLAANRLEQVPSDALSALGGSLRLLDLSANYMRQVEAGAFAQLGQLETLRLSEVATLQSIHRDALVSLNGSLHTLVVSNNRRLRSLDSVLVSSMTALRYADLSGNGLETLGRLDPWPAMLEHLDLSGNPLQCNCSMHWLWQHQQQAVVGSSSAPMKDIVCHGPAPLVGRHFFQLEESHLVCLSGMQVLLIALVSGLVLTVLGAVVAICCWYRRRHSGGKKQLHLPTTISPPLPHLHHHLHHPIKAQQQHTTTLQQQHLNSNTILPPHLMHHHHHHLHYPQCPLPDSPPLKNKTLALPQTVDYFLNEDDYVYHPGGHPIKPIPVTAV